MAVRTENLGQDLKAWAADQLHVDGKSAPHEIRAEFLRQVQHDNGTVGHPAREALLILTGRGNAARPTLALEAVEAKLQREVNDFAKRFFSLPIADRKAEWENLQARGQGFPRVAARLAALRGGLYIILPLFDRDSLRGQLIDGVGESFVRRPLERAVYQQKWVADAKRQDTRFAWAKSADGLLKKHPAIATLDSVMIAQLADADMLAGEKNRLKRRMRVAAIVATCVWIWRVAECIVALLLVGAFGFVAVGALTFFHLAVTIPLRGLLSLMALVAKVFFRANQGPFSNRKS